MPETPTWLQGTCDDVAQLILSQQERIHGNGVEKTAAVSTRRISNVSAGVRRAVGFLWGLCTAGNLARVSAATLTEVGVTSFTGVPPTVAFLVTEAIFRVVTKAIQVGGPLLAGNPAPMVATPDTAVRVPKSREKMPDPEVAKSKGSLIICGGGTLSGLVYRRFLELAGGEKARIVVIPTGSSRADDDSKGPEEFYDGDMRTPQWVKNLHTRNRDKANDPDFVKLIDDATGVWISGGAQEKLMEAYEGTAVGEALFRLFQRGGVIAGTSAGAAVMSRVIITDDYMVNGKPVAKIGTGFGFLPKEFVVDQHFNKRKHRSERLEGVVNEQDRIGLGVYENAALLVEGDTGTVITDEEVGLEIHTKSDGSRKDSRKFKPGDKINLKELREACVVKTAMAP